jgi:hypothetical protein
MDIVNSAISAVIGFAAKSEATYHVNPWIFCILFFGSAIPLYYGYYRIGKSALKFEHGKLHRKEIDKTELKIGVVIAIIAWWVPYIYVIIFGKLPFYLWLIFAALVLVTGTFFLMALRKKILNAEKE